MSLSDNQKILGGILLFLGLLMLIATCGDIWNAVDIDDYVLVVPGVGEFLAACLYFYFGYRVYKEKVTGKINVVASFMTVVGVATVITGLFDAVGGAVSDELSFWSGVLFFIFGLIVIWIASVVAKNKYTWLWALTLLVFIILFISSFVDLFDLDDAGWVDYLKIVCYVIVYLYMICYLCDRDVRAGLRAKA